MIKISQPDLVCPNWYELCIGNQRQWHDHICKQREGTTLCSKVTEKNERTYNQSNKWNNKKNEKNLEILLLEKEESKNIQ